MNFQAICAAGCAVLLSLRLLSVPAFAQQATGRLQITVVDGEGATNQVGQRASDITIQVRDENGQGLSRAGVTFFLPNQGSSGTFPDGSTALTTTSDSQGQATARGIRVNGLPGVMQIRITVSYGGQMANAIVTQINTQISPSS